MGGGELKMFGKKIRKTVSEKTAQCNILSMKLKKNNSNKPQSHKASGTLATYLIEHLEGNIMSHNSLVTLHVMISLQITQKHLCTVVYFLGSPRQLPQLMSQMQSVTGLQKLD